MRIYVHGILSNKIKNLKFKIQDSNRESSTFNLKSLIKTSGFTFLEISLVILVIGIVLSLILPNIGIHKSKLERERKFESISHAIESLYDLAQAQNKEVILSFDIDENSFYAVFSDSEVSLLPKKSLGSDLVIKDIVNSAGDKITQGIVPLTFDPSGFVEPVTIHFIDKNSQFYTLSVNPLTGQSLLQEGYREEE